MEQLAILVKRVNDHNTLGIIFVESEIELTSVLLKVTNGCSQKEISPLHLCMGTKSVEFHTVSKQQITRNLINGNNRRLIEWFVNGEIVMDKDNALADLKATLLEFSFDCRKYKIAIEFSRLIKNYSDGKRLYNRGHFLDAFNTILHALHHLARISIIEHGIYPEITVWDQVKQLEPEIYKLYDEMVTGEESIEKRIELLLIAINFSITSKTKHAASHLIDIIKNSKKAWSVEELLNDSELQELGYDMVYLLEYLVQKGIVDIMKVNTDDVEIFSYQYYIK